MSYQSQSFPLGEREGEKPMPGTYLGNIEEPQNAASPHDPEHPLAKLAMSDEIPKPEIVDLGAIPTIELRAPTFVETSEVMIDPVLNSSPAPPSPGLTACDTSSTTSFDDGIDPANITAEKRQQMIADIFTQLDQLVGLPHVKDQFQQIKKKIEAYQKQGVNLQRERFHIKFLGNPGTGKTTIARLYANLLLAMGVLRHHKFVETSGAMLASGGFSTATKMLHSGVVFIDEAYQLVSQHQPGGRQLMDLIHTKVENQRGHLVLIFAGYRKDMEAFIEHNSGLDSRIPDTIRFDDFNSDELLTILKRKIDEKFGARMKIEAHPDDVDESRYLRIVANRLSRGRDNRGFGNARSVENQLQRISKRQIERLESLPEDKRDYFMFTREDIMGPHPSEARFKSEAWTELQSLIGLEALKEQCTTIIGLSETNYERELRGLDPEMLSFNGVFMGSPGTGKTTVAGLYGRVLVDLGLLSNGEDFVGETLGSSEARTRAILASTIGKVLIIDEAYGLGSSASGSNDGANGNSQDNFRAGVINTIVGEVHGAPGEDRCILLLGYEDQLRDMFQRSNPGLSSRFNYSSPFRFDDFTLDQLMDILHHKLERQNLKVTPEALNTARDVLERARQSPEYGNARAVENCLQEAKKRHQARLQATPTLDRDYGGELVPADFDPDFVIKSNGFLDCEQLLHGKISKSAIKDISRLQTQAEMARWTGTHKFRDVVPTNFIFHGPPGTGKTTAAKLMGNLYYNLGFLATDEVVEVSVRHLIAQFVGQTRTKTKEQLKRALGRVLIIDNAYQLLKGPYEMEALQEIVNCLQSKDYARKMVVILVGYTEEMKMLLHTCPPLAGLFPHEVKFSGLKLKDCMKLLDDELEKINVSAPFMKDDACDDYRKLERLVNALRIGPMFANAKDIDFLAQSMKIRLFDDFFRRNRSRFADSRSRSQLEIPALSREQAAGCVKRFISQRKCMKPLVPFLPQPEIEYSNDDPRFARAFAYEQMPIIGIRIEQATAIPPPIALSHWNADLFEDATEMESLSTFQQPHIGAPALLTHSLMLPTLLSMHQAGISQYFKPQEFDHMQQRIEEVENGSESESEQEDSDPVQSSATADPQTADPQTPDAHEQNPKTSPPTTTSGHEGIAVKETAKISQSERLSSKKASNMDDKLNERRSYRDMLKDKYPFGDVISERTQQALRDLGLCPQGYAWRRDHGRHMCEGGCHYGYDFGVRDYMFRNGY
ncbi:P-loop containing nucleoside triphosphate hydrolase protein [Decorospora gaudefroyi]|uniref:P-loop containing nucleoside triphosphate hydrolase protein n=1 Tax=Decorospora gaudefroyi TaxID=184978 RepID=A0A6A5KB13_9PLEO|nr:P-loop containing nucleoside triphosphate hydrolase protein [Decorospora gaudefroyi]